MAFVKAVKYNSKLRMAICGPSGSGKTYTALNISKHFGRVALIDSENGSASKYADIFDFDVNELKPPYHPNKYIEAIKDAQEYDILIIDSLSHAWAGEGGLLDEVNKIAQRSYNKNSFNAWSKGTPIQNKLIDTILTSSVHVVTTMRSKQEYILEEQDGKSGRKTVVPKKVGMAPVQRNDIEFEFDIAASMDLDNNLIVDKTRCSDLTGQIFPKPGKEVADIVLGWLKGKEEPLAKAVKVVKKVFPEAEVSPDNELENKCEMAITYFTRYGISQTVLEKYFRKTKEEWSNDNINDLRAIKKSIEEKSDPQGTIDLVFGAYQ